MNVLELETTSATPIRAYLMLAGGLVLLRAGVDVLVERLEELRAERDEALARAEVAELEGLADTGAEPEGSG